MVQKERVEREEENENEKGGAGEEGKESVWIHEERL